MTANSDVPNAICTNQVGDWLIEISIRDFYLELLSIPFDGRWMWDETTRELIYQRYE